MQAHTCRHIDRAATVGGAHRKSHPPALAEPTGGWARFSRALLVCELHGTHCGKSEGGSNDRADPVADLASC
jgi:hypothetical protein